jgi:hypothetical protein
MQENKRSASEEEIRVKKIKCAKIAYTERSDSMDITRTGQPMYNMMVSSGHGTAQLHSLNILMVFVVCAGRLGGWLEVSLREYFRPDGLAV